MNPLRPANCWLYITFQFNRALFEPSMNMLQWLTFTHFYCYFKITLKIFNYYMKIKLVQNFEISFGKQF